VTAGILDRFSAGLIRRKARDLVGSAGFLEADCEDLEQELTADLLRRLPQLDESRAKRETFITRVVTHKVASLVRAQKAGLRDYRRRAGSLDDRAEDLDGEDNDCPPVLDSAEFVLAAVAAANREEDRLGLRLDLTRAVSRLPSRLRSLCRRLLRSSPAQIAREIGVHRCTVHEAVRRVRARFEGEGLAAYLEDPDRSRRARVGTKGEPSTMPAAGRGVR